MIRSLLASVLLLFALPTLAAPWPELTLQAEHPVDGMRGGNLSGLALCGKDLWAISDRDDDLLYRLDTSAPVWQSIASTMVLPPAPNSALPWGVRMRNWAASWVRGGSIDFEAVSCDATGNKYLVSEAHAAVLQVPVDGAPNWLKIDPGVIRQARGSGMLLHFNALFEGLAVNPSGDRIWLAAERERRGLLLIKRQQTTWDCNGGCVLLSEGGAELQPEQMPNAKAWERDFADLALFNDKLFTLERNAFRICRRDPATAVVERCWSFAAEALTEPRRYSQPFGLAEALVIDAEGAWVGLDNNGGSRADGESRPIVWRFAAPKDGWSAKP